MMPKQGDVPLMSPSPRIQVQHQRNTHHQTKHESHQSGLYDACHSAGSVDHCCQTLSRVASLCEKNEILNFTSSFPHNQSINQSINQSLEEIPNFLVESEMMVS